MRLAKPSSLCAFVLFAASSFAADKPRVAVGIDVLEQQSFALLMRADGRDARIALVTNATGADRAGRRTIDVLAHAPGVKLVAIFAPEHGIATKVDTTNIEDSKDQSTGIPVYTVYGKTDAERRPRPELLRG
ncbi:MAG TPA: exo-beta-N-acetylmuramidase NamZ domain-containing protein, partial [Blastocatellia bacterium]|nr:exo-beta-N-acetylmuramidase NamZ domain-containing protein [Blastocatellia bacterium]